MAQKITFSNENADPDFEDLYPDSDYDDYSDPVYDDESQTVWAYDDVQDFWDDISDGDFADEVQEFSDYDDVQVVVKQPQQKKKKGKKIDRVGG